MRSSSTPWIGLAALIVMFVLPLLPDWLFEGRRTIKHRPRRHVCGDCGAPWTEEHTCALDARRIDLLPLRAHLRRADQQRSAGSRAMVRSRAR